MMNVTIFGRDGRLKAILLLNKIILQNNFNLPNLYHITFDII